MWCPDPRRVLLAAACAKLFCLRCRRSLPRRRTARWALLEDRPEPRSAPETFSLDRLHQPMPDDAELSSWLQDAFNCANRLFFDNELELQGAPELDASWHQRNEAAGGANPDKGRLVIDPSVHLSLRDLSGTLLHEMVHLDIKDSDKDLGEHGPKFLSRCASINLLAASEISAEQPSCFCRLGRFDTPVDAELLMEAQVPERVAKALLELDTLRGDWDDGHLVGDLRHCFGEAGASKDEADVAAARLQCLSAARSCQLALEAPGGFFSWQLRSKTLARYSAKRVAKDYQVFSDHRELWAL